MPAQTCFGTPDPLQIFGYNTALDSEQAITSTTVTSAMTALDVNIAEQTKDTLRISRNDSFNAADNVIYTNLADDGNTLNIDASGNASVVINNDQPINVEVSGTTAVSGTVSIDDTDPIDVEIVGEVTINDDIPINVNVVTEEDFKPRINDYQATSVTAQSSAVITHTLSGTGQNISAWTVGADVAAKFVLKVNGNIEMVARNSAAERQVQLMFPTALDTNNDVTIEVFSCDRQDTGEAWSVVNGYED